MSKIKFSYQGFKEMAEAMNLRIGKIRKYPQALKEVAEEEVKAAQNRLKISKMTPDGQPWAPWSDSTRKARQADGTVGLGLLYKSGNLHNSFQIEINTNQVIIKNIAPYSAYLQDGTQNMPARPYFGWSKESNKRIQTIFGKFFDKVVKLKD